MGAVGFAAAIKYDHFKILALLKGKLFDEGIVFDITAEVHYGSASNGDKRIDRIYFGYITSRLYLGTDENGKIKQDFKLKWKEDTWCAAWDSGELGPLPKANIF